jgi:hypothetical protein
MMNTEPLNLLRPSVPTAVGDPQVYTKMHQWAHRVKRLLYTKTQVAPGLSRFVIDSEIEPYRVYYRKHGALSGASDEQMITWFYEQPE